MNPRNHLLEKVSSKITNFEGIMLEVFRYQAKNNFVYADYIRSLGVDVPAISEPQKIPFLPISAFKSHQVTTGNIPIERIFNSSGTTSSERSSHFVADVAFYKANAVRAFEALYGAINDFTILALLPSYLEQGGSSLVYMVEKFIEKSHCDQSGFYLNDYQKLRDQLLKLKAQQKKTLLIGVSYALLDFAEQFPGLGFPELTVMETGGMKGRRREIIREELHEQLKKGFGLEMIHSEYGMTELLSQAYSLGDGLFIPAPTMCVYIRDAYDPLSFLPIGKSGGLNIVDLANIDSCSFIATDDLGRVCGDGRFEVLGRLDSSDIRGCNLMVG